MTTKNIVRVKTLDGKIIYDHAGEGGYAETEELLQRLILEKDPEADLPPIMAPVRASDEVGARCYPRTPELYCGYGRGRYGNADDPGVSLAWAAYASVSGGKLFLSDMANRRVTVVGLAATTVAAAEIPRAQ